MNVLKDASSEDKVRIVKRYSDSALFFVNVTVKFVDLHRWSSRVDLKRQSVIVLILYNLIVRKIVQKGSFEFEISLAV